ncbi:hypothetical protein ACP4OV_027013 [Aristida adscensionis]
MACGDVLAAPRDHSVAAAASYASGLGVAGAEQCRRDAHSCRAGAASAQSAAPSRCGGGGGEPSQPRPPFSVFFEGV